MSRDIHPATSSAWDATVFSHARRLAREGKDVPAAAFLMLEGARQYHMAEITRLEHFMDTKDLLNSVEVVDLAIKRLSAIPLSARAGTNEVPPPSDSEAEELAEDAARYRWIRQNAWSEDFGFGAHLQIAVPCHPSPNFADIDAAVDRERYKNV